MNDVQIRVTGTRQEIDRVIELLEEVGISADSPRFYPRRSEPNRFSYYVNLSPEGLTKAIEQLRAKKVAIASTGDNALQPRPYDVVLGGSAKNQPGNRFVLSKNG